MAAAIVLMISELAPEVIPLVEDVVKLIKNHKRPAAAASAAAAAVIATPQDGPTPGGDNDPNSPTFQE